MKPNTHPFLLVITVLVGLGACEFEPVEPKGQAPAEEPRVEPVADDIKSYIDSLPEAKAPKWDERKAIELVALPLSCIDRPQKRSRSTGYLYEQSYTLRPEYEGSLAFYGCSDWHSAVNSTWTMVKVLKEFPDIPIGKLIREKLKNHLSKKSLDGELKFFNESRNMGFERPYGWAWLMKLYTELVTWDDADAEKWAGNLAPLVQLLAGRTIEYLDHLSYPLRIGTHANTAFCLTFMLEYAKQADDTRLEQAILNRAKGFFENDNACPVEYEPSGSDFFSPCLTEAVLMSHMLDEKAFVTWFDQFLPLVSSPEFRSLATTVEFQESYLPESLTKPPSQPTPPAVSEEKEKETGAETESETESEADEVAKLVGAKSHLIGLSLYRAAALKRIAASLPENDPRRQVYQKLAAVHAQKGFETMYEAEYAGTHWIATYAVYMLTAGQ